MRSKGPLFDCAKLLYFVQLYVLRGREMTNSTMGGRLNAETQRRLQALGKALRGETIDRADIKAWAASLSNSRAKIH
jgi:hypothetical protein